MKQIKLIKNRSDIGAGTRGSDMGIDAIEIAAIVQDNYYFNDYPFSDVETDNESVYDKVMTSFAKRIKNVSNHCERLTITIRQHLESDFFPIILSGDHSSALGTISGIKIAYPEKRLGVVWIDAHADLHSPYTTPSGNIHGMPLAAAIADNNMDYSINGVTEKTNSYWEKMKNLGGITPKILPEDLIFFGVRDLEEPEQKQIDKFGIKNYKVAEVRHRGLNACVDEALEILANCDMIYISFDVDSLDCDLVSRGTGTPVSKGFDIQEVIQIINGIISSNKVVSFEISEVNPLLDNKGNRMAEAAFEVLDQVTKTIKSQLELTK